MSMVLRKPMTLAEFLAWEERQELRYEFDGEKPVAMTGGTLNHDDIGGNLRAALKSRLAGGRCRPYGPNVKIVVAGHIRYPDVVVTCTPQVGGNTILEAPVIVFEVLSDSTSRTDRTDKAEEYLATESIQRYVILEQDSIGATVLERQDNGWRYTIVRRDGLLALPEIGVGIPLAECYAGIEFPPEPEDDGR